MIISSRLMALAPVDVRYLGEEGLTQTVAQYLGRVIIREGESSGAFIRPESVWVSPKHRDSPLGFGIVEVIALWSPDPREGVELRGGDHDGEVMPRRREADGMPLDLIVLPPIVGDDLGAMLSRADAPPASRISEISRYRRAGIDSERDRWVYVAE